MDKKKITENPRRICRKNWEGTEKQLRKERKVNEKQAWDGQKGTSERQGRY
jgi:hypothetical protein